MSRKQNSIINAIAAAVVQWPGLTGAELSEKLGIPSAYRRLSEVKKLGLCKHGDKKVCSVSNKTAVTWLPDDRYPEPVRPEETKNQMERRLMGRIAFLEKEIAELKKKLDNG